VTIFSRKSEAEPRGGIRFSSAALFFFSVLVSAINAAQIDPDSFGGPTELQDTFLPAQVRYQSYAESGRVLAKGRWRVTVEEDWTAHLAQTDTYLFDGESVTSTIKLRHSPLENWEFGVDVPYTFRFDGEADEFIEFVETTLNAPVPARFQLPRDTYQATLATPGGELMTLLEEDGFNDLTLRAKRSLLRYEQARVDLAAVATLAVPTGEHTFGSKGLSPGLGLHLQKPVFTWLNLYAGAAGVYYSDDNEQGLELHDLRGMIYGGAAWKPFGWGELLFMYQTYSPLARSNPPLDDAAHYYSITGRFFLGRQVTFEAGVVENAGVIENRNSSDVTFKFALAGHF
jgi:hypothetical protein